MNLSLFAILGASAIGLSLGLLGSGGSILTVPVLVYLVDQPERVAIVGSLLIVGSIALLGSLPYLKQKLVEWNTVLTFGIPSMASTSIGVWFASNYLTGLQQLAIFAFVMLAASYFMIRPKKNLASGEEKERHNIHVIVDGIGVGVVTGIVGVGGGFLIIPALVLLGGLEMRRAVATSLIIITLNSYIGFTMYLLHEGSELKLDWHVIIMVIVLGGVGSFIGNKISNKVPQDKLKKIFGGFLIVMGIYILVKSLPQLL